MSSVIKEADLVLLFSLLQELEQAVLKQDAVFLADLVCCLLQGCYQRSDITYVDFKILVSGLSE